MPLSERWVTKESWNSTNELSNLPSTRYQPNCWTDLHVQSSIVGNIHVHVHSDTSHTRVHTKRSYILYVQSNTPPRQMYSLIYAYRTPGEHHHVDTLDGWQPERRKKIGQWQPQVPAQCHKKATFSWSSWSPWNALVTYPHRLLRSVVKQLSAWIRSEVRRDWYMYVNDDLTTSIQGILVLWKVSELSKQSRLERIIDY